MSAPTFIYPPSSGGGGGGVSGTGTPGTIPLWNTTTALTDSPLSFAVQTLTLSPSVRFFSFGHHQQWTIPANAAGFTINSTQLVLDTGSGYFGINPPTTPAAPLHVEGNVGSSSELVRLRNTLTGANSHVTIQTHANATGSLSPTGQIRNLTTGTSLGYGTYDWQYRLIDGGGSLQQVFNMGAPTVIGSLTLTSGGTGYTNGSYSQVALTNVTGTGTGATADIVVAGGIVTSCTLRNPGSGYVVGSQLSCASIGAGSGFVVTIATVGSSAQASGNVSAPRIGAGGTSPISALHVSNGAFVNDGFDRVSVQSAGSASFTNISVQEALTGARALTNEDPFAYGSWIASRFDGSGATTAQTSCAGILSAPVLVGTNNVQSFSATGITASANRYSPTDIAQAVGCTLTGGNFFVQINSGVGSTVTSLARGVTGNIFNQLAGHTITTAYSFAAALSASGNYGTAAHFRAQPITGTGTITTFYGLRLEASTTPTITNRFGISQEDTLATNVFAATTNTFSGTVRATSSSAAAPAFSTPGDTNTGMYFPFSDQLRLATAGSPGLGIDASQNLQMNSGFGSLAVAYGCRAWVNFDSTATSNLTGTYSQSGTTVTVTVAAHGYSGGERVYVTITSGTAVTGSYVVASVISSSQFTYTAGTSLTTSGNITLNRNAIRTSGGVSSIADISTGIFAVNFSSAMPDVNYSAIGVKQNVTTNSAVSLYDCFTAVTSAPGRTVYQCGWQCIENAAPADSNNINLAFFR